MLPDDPELRYLSLDGLLPEAHRLALQRNLGLVARLYVDGDGVPRLQHVQWFTPVEMALVLALPEQYPRYCPYEVSLSHFTSTRVSERVIDRMREQAYEARESGEWDVLMRPMRNVLSRIRLKLRPFGIEIVSLVEVGYALAPARSRGRKAR
jgi:hypothetical protein